MPQKRNTYLHPISREHYHGLMLCKRMKDALKKNVATARIKKYADWFYKNHLVPHFAVEEKHLFPILGNTHAGIIQATNEHKKIIALFTSNIDSAQHLTQIHETIEKHIRFEERILFNKIQEAATPAQLKSIQAHHTETNFKDNLDDPFWL